MMRVLRRLRAGTMEKAIASLEREFSKLRTGRASTALVDGIKADYYGTPTPISQMASVAVPDSRTVTIQPWDKGGISVVEKAILKSDLGLTPINDGKVIRIMNKGLEVIEAYHLYGVPVERIRVLVHPQSVVHSLVEFHDRRTRRGRSWHYA
jgi:Ribosome recycling factor